MFLAFAITYYFAPDLNKPEWHWITPGSALGLIIWLVASLAFKLYLQFFNSYSKTYGSIPVTAARELTGAQIEALGDFEGIGFSGKMLRIVAQVCCRVQLVGVR
jgi:hypothetical protein